jgi:hypothetical protein
MASRAPFRLIHVGVKNNILPASIPWNLTNMRNKIKITIQFESTKKT